MYTLVQMKSCDAFKGLYTSLSQVFIWFGVVYADLVFGRPINRAWMKMNKNLFIFIATQHIIMSTK